MSPRFLRFVADAVGVGAAFGAASSVIVVVTVVVSSSSTRTQAVCNTVVVVVDEGVDDSAGVYGIHVVVVLTVQAQVSEPLLCTR